MFQLELVQFLPGNMRTLLCFSVTFLSITFYLGMFVSGTRSPGHCWFIMCDCRHQCDTLQCLLSFCWVLVISSSVRMYRCALRLTDEGYRLHVSSWSLQICAQGQLKCLCTRHCNMEKQIFLAIWHTTCGSRRNLLEVLHLQFMLSELNMLFVFLFACFLFLSL